MIAPRARRPAAVAVLACAFVTIALTAGRAAATDAGVDTPPGDEAAPTPRATPAPEGAPLEGIDGLCALVVAEVLPHVASGEPLGLDVAAEGPVVDLASAIRTRCEHRFAASGHVLQAPSTERRRVRLRVRANALALLGMLEVGAAAGTSPAVHTAHLEAKSGRALTSFLAAFGRGLETWQQGLVPGRALAVCGRAFDGPGEARVAVLTTDAVRFLHWGPGALVPVAKVDLPEALRARARAPGATMSCTADEGWLQVTIAVHDRARSALVALSPDGEPNLVENGDDEAWPFPDVALLPLPGTGLLRDKEGRLFGAITLRPRRLPSLPAFVGALQEGRVRLGEATVPAGDGLTLVDLDGDGEWELARTLPVLAGAPGGDRIVVSRLDRPDSTLHESAPSTTPFGALGTIEFGSHAIVVGLRGEGGDTALVAFGLRVAAGAVP